LLVDMFLNDGNEVGFASLDMIHLKGMLEQVIIALQNHEVFQILEPHVTRSPSFNFYLKNGHRTESINMNLTGPDPGKAFFQKHFKKLYIEEASFETAKVYEKRLESVSEKGCVLRISGMTNFTKYSPAGKAFYDLTKKSWIANHPQFVSPLWDEAQHKKAIKDHGGEGSTSYRVFVKGEVVEEGISVFDMERIRPFYDSTRTIKRIEITKEKYPIHPHLLVLERPKNAEEVYIAADIGEAAPTEIAIFFKVNKKYKYAYCVTLYGLTDKEQTVVFKDIISKIQPNFIGLDCTEGTGRAIFRSLEEVIPKDHLVWVGFNEKIIVGFNKNDNGVITYKNGKPEELEEYVTEWSIKRLKELFYEGYMLVPLDYRLDVQLNSVISIVSHNRVIYDCVSEEDHLLAAFRVFAIVQWCNEFNLIKPICIKKWAKTGV